MGVLRFLAGVLAVCHRLCGSERANVTATFALSLVPIVGFVGAAVDYSHANSVKSSLQAATDATALMLSKSVSTMTQAQRETQGLAYLSALFTRSEATGLTLQVTYTTTNGSELLVSSSATVKSDFMNMMGVPSMKVAANSTAKWGNTRLRIALALDVTGSMAEDGKMTAMKTATKNLLDQLKTAATNNGDVYVSIIPFAKDVNVGKSNYQQNWIDWTDWESANGSCSKWGYDTKSSCTNHDGNWTADNRNTWNGCVTDRGNSNGPHTNNYDTNVLAPDTSIKASLFPAQQFSPCPKAVKSLSYDWTAMKDLVDDLDPGGNTNQAIGLAHGWMSLTGGGPYPAPPAKDPNYQYSNVIILLTDGLNTQNRWYSSQSSIDTRQATTCANIKAAGFTLYTIQVNTGGDPTSSLLKTCATDQSKFFLLTSANQMVSTFQTIGTSLSNLRIAQ